MRSVLRRIAIHGGLTAIVLGIVGFMLAELAGMWLAAAPSTRSTGGPEVVAATPNGDVASKLRSRMPLSMALWGFAFVALGEIALHLWRPRRAALAPQPDQHSDEAEKLLLELLAKAESQRAEAGRQKPEAEEQKPEAAESRREQETAPPA